MLNYVNMSFVLFAGKKAKVLGNLLDFENFLVLQMVFYARKHKLAASHLHADKSSCHSC